jgi:hypothetical protein
VSALDVFGYVLGVLLWTAYILAGCFIGWVVATMIQKVRDTFRLQKTQPLTIVGDTEAREAIKTIREEQDRERLNRIRARARTRISKAEPETDQEIAYCICRNPVSATPDYFYTVKFGIHGVSLPRVIWTPLHSMALRMTYSEARKWMNLIGRDGRVFIVPSEVREREPMEMPMSVPMPIPIVVKNGEPLDLTEALNALGGV